MNERIAALEKIQKYVQYVMILLIVLVIATAFCLIKVKPMGMPMILVTGGIYMFGYKQLVKQYQQGVKAGTLVESFRTFLKNTSYKEKLGINPSDIAKTHFLPMEHQANTLIRDTVRGTYQTMPVCLSDITTDYKTTMENDKGSSKPIMNYLAGCYFSIQLKKETSVPFMLWHKEGLEEDAVKHYFSHMKEVEAPTGLTKDFRLFVKNADELPKLSEAFISEVLRLQEYTPGHIAVQASGNTFRVFIRNRFLFLRKVEIKYRITPHILSNNPFPELSYLLRIADSFQK